MPPPCQKPRLPGAFPGPLPAVKTRPGNKEFLDSAAKAMEDRPEKSTKVRRSFVLLPIFPGQQRLTY